jgi:hypothetical protein
LYEDIVYVNSSCEITHALRVHMLADVDSIQGSL